ncbi:hypothetical protein LOTGIDRAFT_228873 [Lottia gigantea]|uniref:Sushi domain-containing protein n=1 Tax=Lottia gigantea TaxID=225164 RepID=V4A4A2_LOTGI|nr:hypothetical protein LOTGIDRAFT_228873 [Lottia gigantea]ESO91517.1 hypothetical protein LOTGIDRAFT_228873 [Lottia gigantea]
MSTFSAAVTAAALSSLTVFTPAVVPPAIASAAVRPANIKGIYDDISYASCDELLMYGINYPHLYFLTINGTRFDTICFDKGVHFIPLLGMNNGSLNASTERSLERSTNEARFYRLNKQSAWRPKSTDTIPWITATFSSECLLSAVSVKGFVGTKSYWCPLLDIGYDDILSTKKPSPYISLGQFLGNNDSSTVVTHYFNPPLVAKSLHIGVKNSEHDPDDFGLRFEIYGESYGSFVHSDRYIGCYGVVENYVLDNHMVNADNCREDCSGNPFYGIAQDELNVETCYCLNQLGKYGLLHDDLCQICIECNYSVGSFPQHSIAVYRTYDKECTTDIPMVGNTTTTIIPGYNHVDVYGFGTVITFECEVGHEFSDGETSKNMYCYNNNTWNPQLDSCQLKMCEEPVALTNGMVEGSRFYFNVTIKYVCKPGYVFSTGAEFYLAVCQSDKTWSSTPTAVCKRLKCSSPPVVVNAENVPDVNYFEDVITYTCKEYTRFPDNTTESNSQCTADGSWTSIETCSFYTCPPPPIMKGAFRTFDNDEKVVYICYGNHFFSDGSTNKSVTCNEEFQWLIDDTCTIPVELFSPKHSFCQSRNGVRRIANNMITLTVRSRMDCALKCAFNDLCLSYNLKKEDSKFCEILLSPLEDIMNKLENILTELNLHQLYPNFEKERNTGFHKKEDYTCDCKIIY